MSTLEFHKCLVCGRIFYNGRKKTYCPVCVPPLRNQTPTDETKAYIEALNNAKTLEERRKHERIKWHARMANPAFRERERLRSLARAKAERKYAKKEGK